MRLKLWTGQTYRISFGYFEEYKSLLTLTSSSLQNFHGSFIDGGFQRAQLQTTFIQCFGMRSIQRNLRIFYGSFVMGKLILSRLPHFSLSPPWCVMCNFFVECP